MFYTLVSRTVITKITTPRDYLYIFLIGSVGYVILHWYLYMEKREGIVEKVREYLYYAMVIDAITAYALMILYPAKTDKKNLEKTNDNEETQEPPYTAEQRKAILQKMQETRRLQQMRQKALAEQKGESGNPETQKLSPSTRVPSPMDTSKILDTNKEKKSIFSKSEESRESNETVTETDEEEKNPIQQTQVQAPETSGAPAQEREDQEPSKEKKTDTKTNKTKSNNSVRVKVKKNDTEVVDTDIPMFDEQKNEGNEKPKKTDK